MISSTTSEVVEVPFNYSGVFLQVEIEPLLARFTVSCILALEGFQKRGKEAFTSNDATRRPPLERLRKRERAEMKA